MKTIHKTSTKLTLHSSGLESWIIGGILLAAGLVIPMSFATKTINNLTCNRISTNQGDCQIQEINRWGKSEPTIISLNELKGAEVREHTTYSKKGRARTSYRVYILSNNHEDIYFTSNSDVEDSDSLANQINEFVSNSEPSLAIRLVNDNYIIVYIIGGVIGFVSLFFIFADDVICYFDKSKGHFYIKRQGLTGKRVQSEQISQITDIQIEEVTRTYNDKTGKTHVIYNFNLVLKSGEKLLLMNGSDRERYQKISDDIYQVLNLKY